MKNKLDIDVLKENLDKMTIATKDFETFIIKYSEREIDSIIYSISDDLFIKYCYLTLHPQSYGSKFQDLFIKKYKLIKLTSKDERGDLTNGKLYIEYKCSIITAKNPTVDIVQIRTNHNMTHYIIQIIDVRDLENCNIHSTLCLTKDQMNEELSLMGSQSAHGKKDKASEFRIDFNYGDDNFNRFIKNYQFSDKIFD